MHKITLAFLLIGLHFTSFSKNLPEMLIGKADISPGITFVFEGAIKDDVTPPNIFLLESSTDIHLEVLANWNDEAPRGSIEGGFIAYLDITAIILNQRTNESSKVFLLPHLNMSDNFHYARNIKLPGNREDLYTIIFFIEPPDINGIGLHYDWREEVGERIIEPKEFTFIDLNFLDIAQATRR
ncbi:MAG: iron transporter [SAR86 cluster bacterium]|jgi:periplasmic iron binding protein|nr:iron transporter [SAR86 cluster bacterium]